MDFTELYAQKKMTAAPPPAAARTATAHTIAITFFFICFLPLFYFTN